MKDQERDQLKQALLEYLFGCHPDPQGMAERPPCPQGRDSPASPDQQRNRRQTDEISQEHERCRVVAVAEPLGDGVDDGETEHREQDAGDAHTHRFGGWGALQLCGHRDGSKRIRAAAMP